MKLYFTTKVSQLSDEQAHHLVKMTRDFSVLFYRVRANIFNHMQCRCFFLLCLYTGAETVWSPLVVRVERFPEQDIWRAGAVSVLICLTLGVFHYSYATLNNTYLGILIWFLLYSDIYNKTCRQTWYVRINRWVHLHFAIGYGDFRLIA